MTQNRSLPRVKRFRYECISHSGERKTGVVAATTKLKAEQSLNKLHRSIVTLKEL